MHKVCCNTTQHTRNQQIAKLSVKYFIGQLFNREPAKGLHVNSTQMLVKISSLSFHTRVTRIETASPLSDSCSDVCGPAPPTLEPADVSTHRYSLCVSGTPSLAWYSTWFKSGEFRHHKSDVMKSGVSARCAVRTARNSLNDVMCYVTSGKSLRPVASA